MTATALSLATQAQAHPHIWIAMRSDVVFDERGDVSGIAVEWTFDDGYAQVALDGLDTNRDGVYSQSELEPLTEENLKSLKDYNYFVVPRVILFRLEHSRRTLVRRVDFISAPGTSPENVYRPGGPIALVTPLCLFAFDGERRRFRLESVHPGHDVDEVAANTGFEFDAPAQVPTTAPPTTSECPPRYFVVLWTEMSAPSFNGFWRYGLAKVLSTTSIA